MYILTTRDTEDVIAQIRITEEQKQLLDLIADIEFMGEEKYYIVNKHRYLLK